MNERIHDPPIGDVVAPPLAKRFGLLWWAGIALAGLGCLSLLYGLSGPVFRGIGVWGTNIPYVWGFDIASYAWWIGIANGAALFAAILVLMKQNLRTAINRFANGLALGAAVCAAIFPVFHLGRPWLAYWMVPYPTAMGLWPQFRSPLTWDFWGILVHLTAIALLWYVGLIPDLATLRDRAKSRRRQIFYGLFALGWRGSVRQWALHRRAHRIVALTLVPLLFVLQTIVAFEFVGTLVPGWHLNRLPLHFAATGLELGIAMTLLIAVLLHRKLDLHRHIDPADIDLLCRLMLTVVLVAAFLYVASWVHEMLFEAAAPAAVLTRMTGGYAWLYWTGLALTLLPPQLFWWRRFRRDGLAAMLVPVLVLAGVYLDYLSIVVAGIQRNNIQYAPASYAPTLAEAGLLAGTLGLFLLLVLVSVRRLPIVSLYVTREASA